MKETTVTTKRGPARPGGGKRKNRDGRKAARRAGAQARAEAFAALGDEGRQAQMERNRRQK